MPGTNKPIGRVGVALQLITLLAATSVLTASVAAVVAVGLLTFRP